MKYTIAQIPLFQELEKSNNVLISGMGGGFDIFSAIPLYFAAKKLGKNIIIGNLSFTWLNETNAKCVFPFCYEIKSKDEDASGRNYFPEKYLKKWFEEQNEEVPVFAFDRVSAKPLTDCYKFLKNKFNIDTVLLVDGGTDSIMFGDEEALGTPQEDMSSLAAVHDSGIKNKLLASIGFGIDHFHGVSHFRFLENVAALAKENGYLGLCQLTKEMEEASKFIQAINYVNDKMPHHPSIVANSIKSALEGEYGNYHATHRTHGSELWINPLMTIYWCFEINALAAKIQYLEAIKCSESIGEFNQKLTAYRKQLKELRVNKKIPI